MSMLHMNVLCKRGQLYVECVVLHMYRVLKVRTVCMTLCLVYWCALSV